MVAEQYPIRAVYTTERENLRNFEADHEKGLKLVHNIDTIIIRSI